jgi:phage head maturation protease
MSGLNFSTIKRWPAPTPTRSPGPLMLRQDVPAAIRAVDAKHRTFSGIASSRGEDTMGDVIDPEGIDLRRWRQGGAPLLRDHDRQQQIGTVVRDLVVGDDWRIEAAGYPAGVTAAADEAWREIAAGGRSGLSIGFHPVAYERRTTARGGEGIHYTAIELIELSSVILPACPSCLLTQRGVHGAAHAGACGCGTGLALELADEPGVFGGTPTRNPRGSRLVLDLADDDPSLALLDGPLAYGRWSR